MVYCEDCGSLNEADAIFCVACGVKLGELRNHKVSYPSKKKSNSKTCIAAVAATAAAVVAVIILGW